MRNSVARIDALQRSSRHYLQRPDRVGHRLDAGARSLTGFGSRYWLNKQNGNVLLNAAVGYMDPRFDVNEMGFMRHADVINGHVGTGYQWTATNAWRRYASAFPSRWSAAMPASTPAKRNAAAPNTRARWRSAC
jgi:hypothetical protein